MKVNGVSVENADHYAAVEVLKACGAVLVLHVSREVTKLVGHPAFGQDGQIKQIFTADTRSVSSDHIKHVPTPLTLTNQQLPGGQPGLPPASAPLPGAHAQGNLFQNGSEMVHKVTLHTTLIRDQAGQGLGFSIAGGKGHAPFRDDCDGIFISRITEGGIAERDGKLTVGDRVTNINGVDVRDAAHDYAVQLLKDSPRFVRLIVERELRGPMLPPQSPRSPSILKGLSPSGYMANRPTYTGYRRSIGDTLETGTPTSTTAPDNLTQVNGTLTQTVGLPSVPPPQPAPRRISSQDSKTQLINGGATSPTLTDNKNDEEPQVTHRSLNLL